MRPSAAGSARKSLAISAERRSFPADTSVRNPGMSKRAGQPVMHGPMQSPA